MKNTSNGFHAQLDIIGINPFVFIPEDILESLFLQANRRKSPIAVKGTVNGVDYQQTLVKYKGYWRLYINTSMLKDSPKRIGELLTISINFDPEDRTLQPHPKWSAALAKTPDAEKVFNGLTRSKQQEIIRYFWSLKTEESINNNIQRAINFLLGNERFLGRDKP